MPKAIGKEHMERMFPFEFFDELSEQLKEYVFHNPAFLLRDKMKLTDEKRREVYQATRDNEAMDNFFKQNIIEVEPFGEVLVLELCCAKKDVDTIIQNEIERSQIPISILVCQLYDSSGLPVFATDVTEETIAKIPEVLWDDPNLMLSIVSFSNDNNTEAQAGIIKIPKHVEHKFFEPVNDTNDKKK